MAKRLYCQVWQFIREQPDGSRAKAECLSGLARIRLEEGKYQRAIRYSTKARQAFSGMGYERYALLEDVAIAAARIRAAEVSSVKREAVTAAENLWTIIHRIDHDLQNHFALIRDVLEHLHLAYLQRPPMAGYHGEVNNLVKRLKEAGPTGTFRSYLLPQRREAAIIAVRVGLAKFRGILSDKLQFRGRQFDFNAEGCKLDGRDLTSQDEKNVKIGAAGLSGLLRRLLIQYESDPNGFVSKEVLTSTVGGKRTTLAVYLSKLGTKYLCNIAKVESNSFGARLVPLD